MAAEIARVIVVARKIEIQAQKWHACTRREPKLEIVGKQFELSAALTDDDAEVEPGSVTSLEVWNILVALLILFSTDDTERLLVEVSGSEVFEDLRWWLWKEPHEFEDLVWRLRDKTRVRRR